MLLKVLKPIRYFWQERHRFFIYGGMNQVGKTKVIVFTKTLKTLCRKIEPQFPEQLNSIGESKLNNS